MTLTVRDGDRELSFTFDDLTRYAGFGAVGGVAHAYKALERALPLLSPGEPAERREIEVRTPHPGPGVRDGIEMVTRAVTEGRYTFDKSYARTERGRTLEWFAFEFRYRGKIVTLIVREAFVPTELIGLVHDRTPDQHARFEQLKQQMADKVLAHPADQVYDVE
ncbi:hypothetical protein [Antrihabitans sp. YC2-6]|uniref:hypothetical protein n=1 Tax=Antrihabitans sp. YC2-6 TaxID=2799498 RepID=UPI0018F31777|nr:hypothetical protein [Antrihabitans sp. YC2-6]MBJ8343351.1 hypothetical protein [Antrihabitans sp. YC2-6]